MKKIISLNIFILLSNLLFAQNLVLNPSFENLNMGSLRCSWYEYKYQFNAAINDWTDPTDGSPDIFHTSLATSCFCSPYSTHASGVGYQTPRTGNSMSALFVYGSGGCTPYREYIAGKLSSPMIPGQQYCVEFYVSLADKSTYACNNIGVYFTTSPVDNNSMCVYNVTPQVNYTGIITDKTNWTLISMSFTPTVAYTNFMIGNFYYDVNTTTINVGGSRTDTRYYIDDVDIHLCAMPPVVSVNNASICAGQSATLTASGANTYSWSNGSTGSNITVSPTSTTTYTVTGTTAGGTNSASATVTVNPNPTVSVSASSTSLCQGASTTLTASGASTYSWSTGATGNSISVTPSGTITYTVTGTNAAGCSATSTISITVNPIPTISLSGTSICAGSSATLTASGAAIYSWNNGNNTPSITVNPTTTTSYSVTGTNAIGCTNSASATVTVNPLPNIGISASQTSVCPGQSTNLTGTGGTSYTWSTGASGTTITVSPTSTSTYSVTGTDANNCSATGSIVISTLASPVITTTNPSICEGSQATITASGAINYTWSDGSTGSQINVSPTSTTSYTVSGTDGSGCAGIATATVTVNPVPTITLNGNNICAGATTNITAAGANSYIWDNGSTSNPIQVSPASTTTYTVTGSDGNNCSNTASITITVNALPSLTVSSTDDYCNLSNGTTTVVAANGLAPYSYSWNTNPAQTTNTATGLAAGQYEVTVTDDNGCEKTAIVTVFAKAAFTISSGSQVEHCKQNDGSASVLVSNNIYTLGYSWSHNNSLNSPSADNLSAGTYTVTVSDSNCVQTISIVVGSHNGPTAGYHITPSVANVEDGPVTFNDASGGVIQWFYDFDDGSFANIQNPQHQYTGAGTYNTMQIVSDQFGCVDTAFVSLVVNEGFAFYIPSAFSPNGDGRNDYFTVYGYGIDLNTFEIAIYDRWGKMVFHSTDINNMWDGGRSEAKEQKKVNQDVYSYRIFFKTLAGRDKEYFGHVVVLP